MGQPVALLRTELTVCPLGAHIAHLLHSAGRGQRHLLVVAAQHRGALGLQGHDAFQHLGGVRSVAHQVAQKRELLRTLRPRVRQAGLQRMQIAVDVGKQCQFHDRKLRRIKSHHHAASALRSPCALGGQMPRRSGI